MSTPKSALGEHDTPPNPGQLVFARAPDLALDRSAAENGQRALLNILEDFAAERTSLESGQRAMLNILDDFEAEKARMEGAQRAVLNILEDSLAEKTQLEAAQRSILNILDDFASEKAQLEAAQGAMVNILDDFASEKTQLQAAQGAMVNILDDFASEKTQLRAAQGALVNILDDFAGEKARLGESQRAVLNILDDFETEKTKVELANQQLGKEIDERKRAEEELARRAEELARSNAELQQFAYVASHDLQEPLRMVASFTQLLAQRYEGKLGDDADEFIGYAVDGARRMQGLVNDLLAYSRVGTQGKDFAPVDCEKVLETALANLQKSLKESGGQVTHDPLPTVQADETQLGQVLQNLVGNALKFHGAQPPRVHVSAQEMKGEWRFSVRDNGIGIDPQHAERIFLVFQRLHTRAEYPGTGIGLAITKKIVERHGGRIWLESEPGKSSTFHFSLPMKGDIHGSELEANANG